MTEKQYELASAYFKLKTEVEDRKEEILKGIEGFKYNNDLELKFIGTEAEINLLKGFVEMLDQMQATLETNIKSL